MPVHYPLGWSNVQFLERIGVLDHRERAQVRRPAIILQEIEHFIFFLVFFKFISLSSVPLFLICSLRLRLFQSRFPFSRMQVRRAQDNTVNLINLRAGETTEMSQLRSLPEIYKFPSYSVILDFIGDFTETSTFGTCARSYVRYDLLRQAKGS